MIRLAIITVATIFAAFLVSGLDAQPGRKDIIAGPVYEGNQVTCDVPPQLQMRNVAARANNAGCCVFTSMQHAAHAQGITQMDGFRDWVARTLPGGGYPDRVDDYLKKWWAYKKIDPIPYAQFEERDPAKVKEILEKIDRTRRPCSVTYGWSQRMGTGSHMVSCLRFRPPFVTILDNNYVAKKLPDGSWDENVYEWLTPEETVRRMRLTSGSAWIFVWLTAPPPPVARNKKPSEVPI